MAVADLVNLSDPSVARGTYIGGSDFTDLLSLPPYGCARRLWLRKRGEGEPLEETPAMRRGKKSEALAADEYAEKTGRKLRQCAAVSHATYPYFVGHIDRHIVDQFDGRGPGVLEIKVPGEWAFKRIKREGLPQGYIAQLQWYMFLKNWKWGAYGIMNLNSWELLHWDVERDEVMIELLVNEAHSFWRLVDSGPMPDALDKKDRRCTTCQFRQRCHGEETMPEFDGIVERDDSLGGLMAEYAELTGIAKDASELVDDCKDRIKTALGSRQCVDAPGGRIYHTKIKRKAYSVAAGKYTQLRIFQREDR